MPQSIHSQSSATGSSNGRNLHKKFTRYRMLHPTSTVDETLFGNNGSAEGAQGSAPTNKTRQRRRSLSPKSASPQPDREYVRLVTKDLIRDLLIPKDDPSGHSTILSANEFERLRGTSKVLTQSEREARLQALKEERERAEAEANARRAELKAFDAQRKQNAKLTDLDEEAREKAEHLLKKANELREEQEDDIKKLNEYILEAKCHAIRDAQVLEHDQVRKEMQVEERRLDEMMEAERQNALRVQEEIERRRREESYLRALQILDQIKENEKERLLELESKDQENMQMQRALHKLMEEERDKLVKKRSEQTVLRDELNRANDDMIKRKVQKKEQEKLLDLKVLEFQRQKAEREAAFEKEQERVKAEKEREVARLRALQQRAQDEQAERDALRAKRSQEEAERAWRRKEAEEARKRALTEQLLAKARVEQQTQKEHMLAVEAARDRAEFERVLRAQKELIEKERAHDEDLNKRTAMHSDELREQIRKREAERIADRNRFFEEAIKAKEEARLARQKLEAAKARKMVELRECGIPDKYLVQVERKLHRPQHVSA